MASRSVPTPSLGTDAVSHLPASVIDLDAVSMQFAAQPVLRGVSLAVARGETVAVIGESGCGKTVLLKLIVGLLAPQAGRVAVEGRALATLGPRDLSVLRRRIGFLFQGAALFDSLTAYENVAFPLRQWERLPETEIRERVRARLDEVGLVESVAEKMPAELSGGMRKRVGLARALALDPEVMLYDEPTTGLDPVMTDVINELIVQTRRRRPVTSVVVTHDMKTVRAVADRVVMLCPLTRLGVGDSQVIFEGPPAALESAADARVRAFVA